MNKLKLLRHFFPYGISMLMISRITKMLCNNIYVASTDDVCHTMGFPCFQGKILVNLNQLDSVFVFSTIASCGRLFPCVCFPTTKCQGSGRHHYGTNPRRIGRSTEIRIRIEYINNVQFKNHLPHREYHYHIQMLQFVPRSIAKSSQNVSIRNPNAEKW